MVMQSAEPPAVIDPNSPAERRSRRLRWSFYIVVALVVPFSLVMAAAAVVWLWWQLDHLAAVQEVKAEVARIQATGQPVTIADWYAYHRVPEGANDTTALWLAAMKSYQRQMSDLGTEAHKNVPIVGEGDRKLLVADVPGSLLPATESLLAKYDPTVQAMLTAARAGGQCRYPVRFELGIATPSAHVQDLRGLVRIMSLRTRVAVARGKPDLAMESIDASFAAARSFEHQPSLVEDLVRVAVTGAVLHDIRDLLSEADLTDEQLMRLQTQVQGVQLADGFTTALLGERGVGYHSFHTFPPTPATTPAPVASGPMAGGELTSPRPCLVYLGVMEELIDDSHMAAPKCLDEVRLVSGRLATQAQSSNPLTRMNTFAAAQVLPAVEAAFTANARTEAWRGMLMLAIAERRFELKHGSVVATPDQLVPEFLPAVPIDSFDGQPLRMKVTTDQIVFYSVGMDRIDQGGQDPDDHGVPDMLLRLKIKHDKE
jgi:hypothetical protein